MSTKCDQGKGVTTPVTVNIPEGGSQPIVFDYTQCVNGPAKVSFYVTADYAEQYVCWVTDHTPQPPVNYFGQLYQDAFEFYNIPAQGHYLTVNFFKLTNPAQIKVQEIAAAAAPTAAAPAATTT